MTDKKYSIIYADPPWSYRTWSKKGKGRSAENHYPTMKLQDICALPVREIAAENAALFMWATFPNLPEALEVIKAWGFEYKTVAFCWVKRNKKSPGWFVGLGHWTRANAEICLLATRGNPKRVSKGVRQVIDTPIEKHSKKPDEIRDRIVTLMGDLPRIELFAREQHPGWDVFGNEVKSTIELGKDVYFAKN
jgi:N6-adenosine-specific RNA methylase IME4